MRLSYLAIVTATVMTTTSAYADCKGDIQAILKGMETSGAYRIDMVTSSNGVETTIKGEAVLPHSFHITSKDMEMVMTPNGVWMSQGGALQKMPNEMRAGIEEMIKKSVNLGVNAVASEQCLGSVAFEDGTYDHYKYDGSAEFMGIPTKSLVDLYVDGSGKPAWVVVDGEAMGQKSLTKQHIVFDDSIVIADPQ